MWSAGEINGDGKGLFLLPKKAQSCHHPKLMGEWVLGINTLHSRNPA
jgi:hypothetical protein